MKEKDTKVSQYDKNEIRGIVEEKLLEHAGRIYGLNPDTGVSFDTAVVTEGVMSAKPLNESIQQIVEGAFEDLTEALILNISRQMSRVAEQTSVDDVNMFVDNGQDQLEELADAVMPNVRSILEAYSKAFVATVCEVANASNDDEG